MAVGGVETPIRANEKDLIAVTIPSPVSMAENVADADVGFGGRTPGPSEDGANAASAQLGGDVEFVEQRNRAVVPDVGAQRRPGDGHSGIAGQQGNHLPAGEEPVQPRREHRGTGRRRVELSVNASSNSATVPASVALATRGATVTCWSCRQCAGRWTIAFPGPAPAWGPVWKRNPAAASVARSAPRPAGHVCHGVGWVWLGARSFGSGVPSKAAYRDDAAYYSPGEQHCEVFPVQAGVPGEGADQCLVEGPNRKDLREAVERS